MYKFIVFSIMLLLGTYANTQTLAAGDLAFIGYNTDGTDDFAFITLTPISGGTVFYLTDEGWNSIANDWVGTTETHLVFTAPPSGLPCGTVVHINETAPDVLTIGCAVSGSTISIGAGTAYNLSAGDQVLAYQAASPRPATPPTFIAGVQGDDGNGSPLTLDPVTGWNDLCCTSAGVARSSLPAGLTNGVNCVSLFPVIGTELDNAKYIGSLTGTSTALRASINNRLNWSADDITPFDITFGSYSPSVTCVAPCTSPTLPTVSSSVSTVCSGGSATLTITGTLNDATQWSVYTGSCGGTLLGTTTTSTFVVSPSSNTTYFIRGEGGCVTPGSCGTVTVNVSNLNLTPASQTNIACFGGSNGAASVNAATGGAGGYSYNWTPGNPVGDGTTNVTGLSVGIWTCTVTDANSCTKTQNFTIIQPSALVVTPASQTNIACFGGANGAASINTPTGGAGGYTYNWTPGNPTGDGTTNVTGLSAGIWTCTVTDANACTASQNFTITQPSALALTIASQTNVSCLGGSNGAASVNPATGGNGGYTYNWTPGNPIGEGTVSVTGLLPTSWSCIVTDVNGCTAFQSFNITQPSGITFTQASQTNPSCGSNDGAASVNPASGGAGGFTYNWTPGNPTGDGTTSVTGLSSGSWTCTATDANGCTATQTFTLTGGADATPPTAVCQNINVYLNVAGTASIVAADIDGGSTDNCGPVTFSASTTTFTCANIGSNNVILTATDGSGNSSTCTAVVTVLDTISPIAICQNINLYLDGAGNTSLVAADIDGGSVDNCGAVTLSASTTFFTCANTGPNSVILTVTDGSGNSSTCTATVTVVDTISPVAICQNIIAYLNPAGVTTVLANNIDGGSFDNCGSVTFSPPSLTFTCGNLGSNNFTLTVTDGGGNTSTCMAVVTVIDTISPVAVCQNITAYLDGSGTAIVFSTDVDGGSVDNCWIAGLASSPAVFNCSNIGANNVTLTVSDGNGNTASCVSVVTIFDTIPPTIACPGNQTESISATCNFTLPDYTGLVFVSDNCGSPTVIQSPAPGTVVTADQVITMTANDGNGNVATCTFNVILTGTGTPATGTDIISDCNPITWIDGNTYSASNNTATWTIPGGAASGCDSIVTLDFTYLGGAAITNTYNINTATNPAVGGTCPNSGIDATYDCAFDGQPAINLGSFTDLNAPGATVNSIDLLIYGACSGDVNFFLNGTPLVSGTATGLSCSCQSISSDPNLPQSYTVTMNPAIQAAFIAGGVNVLSVSSANSVNGAQCFYGADVILSTGGSPSGVDTQVACDTYSWIDGNTYTSSNNTATWTIPGGAASGCDSLVTLNLTINNTATGTDVQTACGTYFWIDGNTYNASNNTATWTILGGAASGCDSIVTLDLTITVADQVTNVGSTNITSTSALITWDAIVLPVTGSFAIQYRQVGSTTWLPGTFAASVSSSATLSGLTAGTSYEVRVIASCSTGAPGAPSLTHTFTTVSAACDAPLTLSVAANNGHSITVSWTAIAAAGWYEFRYKESSSATWLFGGTQNATATSKIYSGLLPNTSYDFEARTFCPNGTVGAWSTTLTVTTNGLAGCSLPPALVASIVTGSNVTITWALVPTAAYYAFRYKEASSATWISGGTAGPFATSKSYTGLNSNTLYDFEGRTYCANGVSSAWGATTFTTAALAGCELPPVLDLTAVSTASSIQISWPAVAGATWYSFQYKESSSSTWLNGGSAGPSATSKTYSGLLAGTSYDFQARTHCANNAASAWSTSGVYSTLTGAATIASNDSGDGKAEIEVSDKALAGSNHLTTIYPNPTSDKINIEIFMDEASANTTVQLMDMSGRLIREVSVSTEKGMNTFTLDVQELSNGMYTMFVYQNGQLLHTDKVKKN